MTMYVGLTSDYTQAIKEYIPQGQKQSLWEQFFTGTEEAYTSAAQQAQDVSAYDISEAYANYKKQQLQLKMNEKLGTGFVEDLSSQLQTEYEKTYEGIKTQEAEALSDIYSQYAKAIQTGEEQFTELGKQVRAYDELLMEYSQLLEGEQYMVPSDFRDIVTGELTDAAKLWYYDVREGVAEDYASFDEWLLSEDVSDKYSLEDRETLWEIRRQNPELFTKIATGLTSDFDIASARQAQTEKFYNTAMATKVALSGKLNTANSGTGDNFEIKYDDKTYKVEKGARADNDTQGILTSTYKNRYGKDSIDEGTVVMYRGELYIYIENNDNDRVEWNKIQGRKHNRDDINQLAKELGLSLSAHTADVEKAQKKAAMEEILSKMPDVSTRNIKLSRKPIIKGKDID